VRAVVTTAGSVFFFSDLGPWQLSPKPKKQNLKQNTTRTKRKQKQRKKKKERKKTRVWAHFSCTRAPCPGPEACLDPLFFVTKLHA